MADRDKRVPLTPPHGVRAQIAPSSDWEGPTSDEYTPIHPTPVPGLGPVDLNGIDRRVKETKNASITTLDRVELYRKETREDIGRLEEKVHAQGQRVSEVVMAVGDLKGVVGKAAGQNELILDILREQKQARENTEHIKTTTRIAEVEIDKTRALTDIEIKRADELALIESKKETRKVRLELVKNGAVKLGAILAAVLVGYLSRCGG